VHNFKTEEMSANLIPPSQAKEPLESDATIKISKTPTTRINDAFLSMK
jgi:hypothetical protein